MWFLIAATMQQIDLGRFAADQIGRIKIMLNELIFSIHSIAKNISQIWQGAEDKQYASRAPHVRPW
jgi:hypothetical protein